MPFEYEENLQYGKDSTEYNLIAKAGEAGVSAAEFDGKKILKVSRDALVKLTEAAYSEVSFRLRPEHTKQVAAILSDPEASQNDKLVAFTMLQNSCVANEGILPFCQDTGTAAVFVKKGQHIWTDFNDAEAISEGIYNAYAKL
ncbi:MAG: fumarate hydratase, partial [Candidatus Fibromonas sp.]|nr:fumarate hydratase [Candidatus Fibromonas sp.]